MSYEGRPDFIPADQFRKWLKSAALDKLAVVGGVLPSSFVLRCASKGKPIPRCLAGHRMLDIVARARADGLEITPPRVYMLAEEISTLSRKVAELRQQIEALEAEAGSAQRRAALRTQVKELLSFTLLTEKEILAGGMKLKDWCGIYFLIREGRVVYVGQSVNAPSRVSDHRREKKFDSWAFLPCSAKQLDLIESLYIHTLRPECNASMTVTEGRVYVHAPLRLDELFTSKLQ